LRAVHRAAGLPWDGGCGHHAAGRALEAGAAAGAALHTGTQHCFPGGVHEIRQRRLRGILAKKQEDLTAMVLKVAILGCGKIADAHVEQARATGLAEVVAVCDRERMMAEQLALRYGVPGVYDDLGDLLRNHHVDVVHIAPRRGTQVGLAAAAAAAGCHVFVEKPVASTADDADELIRVVTGAGRKLAANLLYNFETPTLELLAAIEKGEIGEVVHVDATYGYDLAGAYGVASLSDPNHWVHSLPGKLLQIGRA